MTFYGYERKSGRPGVRNHVIVVPAVICAQTAARKICEAVPETVFVYNPNGCGQSKRDANLTLNIITGIIANPNVYGALIVGLGCEQIRENDYLEAVKLKADKPVKYISIQSLGGISKTAEEGKKIALELISDAKKCQRKEFNIRELFLGLECGGSDPTSGLSSNVVLGKVTDALMEDGGTAALSETTEAIGAENILRKQGKTAEIGDAIYQSVCNWEKLCYSQSGENVRNNNPSPGNIKSGITSLSEKSLGCIHKAGSHKFDGLFSYGEFIDQKGLFFIDATPYDVVNVTALAAAGAQIIAFTTGVGNPVGNPIVPVIKITGNNRTAKFLDDFIDFDTSSTLNGVPADEEGRRLLNYIIDVANGRLTKAEINGSCEIGINQMGSYV